MVPSRSLYPANYREKERQRLLSAVRAGDCVAVIGLSGAGKSNFIRSLVNSVEEPPLVLVDCNRLKSVTSADFLRLLLDLLIEEAHEDVLSLSRLESVLRARLGDDKTCCLLFDRFDVIQGGDADTIYNHLRVLRDVFKYRLTYVIAMRSALPVENELSELFFANTIWLGPLTEENARWSVRSYFERYQMTLDDSVVEKLIRFSGGYPAFLRAVCEAHRAGVPLSLEALAQSPSVRARLAEFWRDAPDDAALEQSYLENNPLLAKHQPLQVDETSLTAKEKAFWEALVKDRGEVCEKDDLVRAIWPEEVIFERGVRDDSLAQLARRLREKIEADPSNPEWIITVPGRGYLLKSESFNRE
jgi:DNA-binding winged helix-turn-helix (wHTH) protein